jgi:hypothetical protein
MSASPVRSASKKKKAGFVGPFFYSAFLIGPALMTPYLRFRMSAARHGVEQVAASMRGSLEIVILTGGPLFLGLLATAALPPVLAANLPWFQALPLLLLHALGMTLPAWLLRAHLLPTAARDLLRSLPVRSRARLRADALVAGMATAPLALAYLASLGILLWQQPAWMGNARGVGATVLSYCLTWVCTTLLLSWRGRPLRAAHRRMRTVAPAPYTLPMPPWHAAFLWRRLFWLPAWRSATGPRQAALLVASCVCAYGWMRQTVLPPALMGLFTSALLVLLAHLGDQATRTQISLLRPVMAGWPMHVPLFEVQVRTLTLAPSLVVCAALFASSTWPHLAGRLYLALSFIAPALLVALPATSPRTRVAWVVAAILILTAIGSER